MKKSSRESMTWMILWLKIKLKRYKNSGENHNYKLYLKIKELATIKNILEENYLDFFLEVYYKSERNINLSKYQDDENLIKR